MDTENKTNNPDIKESSKFTKILKAVFVRNIGYKIAALLVSASLWLLAVGLG